MAVIKRSKKGVKFYGGARDMWRFKGQEGVLAGPYETGKAQPLDEPVLTPDGWRPIGQLAIGDAVCVPAGGIAAVVGVFPQGARPVYRVTLSDGATTLADADHLWEVWDRFYPRETVNGRRRKIPGGGTDRRQVLTTAELAEKRLRWQAGTKNQTRRKYWVRSIEPVALESRPVPIDPYLMGVLLSEGCLRTSGTPSFTTADEEVAERCLAALDEGMAVRVEGIAYHISDRTGRGNRLTDALRELGLWGELACDKFVPDLYKYNDMGVRLAVLQGLLDGDGTVGYNDSVSFSTASEQLADDVRELVRSLGGTCTINPRTNAAGNMDYRTRVSHPDPGALFHLERKSSQANRELPVRRMVDSVERVGETECVCIAVDHPDHLYITRDFIPTHNTFSMLHKVNTFLSKYPGARGLMVRKTQKSLSETVVPTFENKVLAYPPSHPLCPIEKYGGERPSHYVYPNGSRLVLAGMDNPGKALSSEWDIIYCPQCEELSEDDWETLLSRATGRARGAPYAQVIGDANPAHPGHWIKQRQTLQFINASHRDNPTIYERDAAGKLTGHLTPYGEKAMTVLKSMTGLRYKRGFLGLWVGAEGAVYDEWDETVHVIDKFNPPESWVRYRVIDFGYTNPFVCQYWAEDEDGRLYMYRELYLTGKTVQDMLPLIHKYSAGDRFAATIADWDAEDRATLHQGIVNPDNGRVLVPGIPTIKADKRVSVGIDAVHERLKIRGDDKPRLFIMRGARVHDPDTRLLDQHKPTCTLEEIPYYQYPDTRDGKNADENPIKEDDHGSDCIRYLVMFKDGPPEDEKKTARAIGGRRRTG